MLTPKYTETLSVTGNCENTTEFVAQTLNFSASAQHLLT